MRVLLWIGDESNQKALASKIALKHNVVGIITETKKKKKPKLLFIMFLKKVIERLFFYSPAKAWLKMISYCDKQYPSYPKTNFLNVSNINSEEAFDFSEKLNADIIIVSGTRLVKSKMLSLKPNVGIINLHTGLSPYIKGGPNCTNWCIATKNFHLIGNTIMWIDIGIDTGNIITTEFTTFDGNENLFKIQMKVMEHAHDLYVKAIGFLEGGGISNVKQADIAKGKTYYSRQWTLKQKIKLISNLNEFKKEIKSIELQGLQENVNIVKLPQV